MLEEGVRFISEVNLETQRHTQVNRTPLGTQNPRQEEDVNVDIADEGSKHAQPGAAPLWLWSQTLAQRWSLLEEAAQFSMSWGENTNMRGDILRKSEKCSSTTLRPLEKRALLGTLSTCWAPLWHNVQHAL